MPSFRDLKGRDLEEAATSRDDVNLAGEEDGVSAAVGRTIVVSDNPHRDEIREAMAKAEAARAAKPRHPPRVRVVSQVAPAPLDPRGPSAASVDAASSFVAEVRPSVPLPEDFESALVALEVTLGEVRDRAQYALGLAAGLRLRAQADHEKLTKVEALIAALKG